MHSFFFRTPPTVPIPIMPHTCTARRTSVQQHAPLFQHEDKAFISEWLQNCWQRPIGTSFDMWHSHLAAELAAHLFSEMLMRQAAQPWAPHYFIYATHAFQGLPRYGSSSGLPTKTCIATHATRHMLNGPSRRRTRIQSCWQGLAHRHMATITLPAAVMEQSLAATSLCHTCLQEHSRCGTRVLMHVAKHTFSRLVPSGAEGALQAQF